MLAAAVASASLRRRRNPIAVLVGGSTFLRQAHSRAPRRHHAPPRHPPAQPRPPPPPSPPPPPPRPPPPLPPGVLRGVTDAMMKLAVVGGETAASAGRAAADAAASFWPSGVPRSLPPWVSARLHWTPEAWSPRQSRWLPAEWTARPSQRTRVAILDALCETQAGAQCVRLAPALVARALSPPGTPAALAVPPRPIAAAAEAAMLGPLGTLNRPRKPPGIVAKGLAKVAAAIVAGLRLVEAVARAVWLSCLFAPLAFSAKRAFAQQPKGAPQRTAWADSLRTKLERAGPAFIKWGQWAATRLDLFPPDLCASLERLHASAPAHPRSETVAAVRRAFGVESLDELFEGFPDQPLASGSIGQVYRARLSASGAARARLPAGTVVAVKVRHPGVGHAVARDFGIMMTAAALATSLVPSLREARLDETLRQFEAPLREQVDLSREAAHLWQFVFNFRDRPDVRFPQPVFPLVAPSVLVETFEEGGPIGDHVAAGPAGQHGAELAAIGSAAVLRMLLCDNLIHADLHPGNILVRLDPPPLLPGSLSGAFMAGGGGGGGGGNGGHGGRGDGGGSLVGQLLTQPLRGLGCAALRLLGLPPPRSWLKPSLVLLDVGMTTSLGPKDRETMVALFTAFSRGDGRGCAGHALRFSDACGEKQRCPDPEAFKRDMEHYFAELDRERALAALPGGTPTDGGKALAGVLELIRQHRVSLPGHICAVLVTTLVLEGWSSRLDPSHSPIGQVEALLAPEKNTAFGRMVTRWDEARESLDPRCDVW